MELYVLDSLYRKIAIVDDYESLIWTERFSDAGDFELKLSSTSGNRNLFTEGTHLALDVSSRVMTVEVVEDATDDNGDEVLTISGPSLEAFMKDRVAYDHQQDLTTDPGWIIPPDTTGNVARYIFDWVCIGAHLNADDQISGLEFGSVYSDYNPIPESTTEISITIAPQELYTLIKTLCDSAELGFRMARGSTPYLYFEIYSGVDRTTRQTTYRPVIFSPDLDNLTNTTELTVLQDSKNVAYVYGPAGFVIVYGEHVPEDITGFGRRILMVDGSSVAVDAVNPVGDLTKLGQDALMAARASVLFDGEVSQYSDYIYDQDYRVGDLVEVRNKDGVVTYKRVAEHIFTSDETGERSYPTLTADVFAGTEDWLSFDASQKTWADYTDDTAWEDMD